MESELVEILTSLSEVVFWGFCAFAFLIGLFFWSSHL